MKGMQGLVHIFKIYRLPLHSARQAPLDAKTQPLVGSPEIMKIAVFLE